MKASNSHVTSSVQGPRRIKDMGMTVWSRVALKAGAFHHSHFSKDDRTMCGFIIKHTNKRGTHNWWLGMQGIVVKTHSDLCNNAIKSIQIKFKGEEMK
jgi:hypothetical protein